jgi:capsular exopolysaccharide synthesis family protein
MSVTDFLSILWHRKLIVLGVLTVAIIGAVGALRMIDAEYRSTATLAVTPRSLGNQLLFLQTVNQVVSIYATAADTETTLAAARRRNAGRLASISVRTFDGAPIFKIDARATSRTLVATSAQAVADALVSRAASGQIGISGLVLKEIDRPTVPVSPIYPNRQLTYLISVLIGLGLGFGGAFVRESLGRRVRTRTELGEAAGVPVFAEIPLTPRLRRTRGLVSLVADPHLRLVAIALRELRTNLSFAGNRLNSIVVTSPEGRHGKTTVAAGICVTMAQTGMRVVLVDADLHRGRIAELARLAQAPGLREVLEARDLGSTVRHSGVANVDVLTSGRLEGDPGELLATGFPRVLQELEQEYDLVVIDAPPVVPIHDARILARLAKATVVVCAAGRASEEAVQDAVDRLTLIGVTPTAAVLNMSRTRQSMAYYGAPEGSGERVANGANVDEAKQHRAEKRREVAP